MILFTSIANPQRLDKYLPHGIIKKIYLADHAYFDENSLKEALVLEGAESLLITQKDAVKMKDFKLPLSLMKLELKVEERYFNLIDDYIKGKKC
jgi:tetraacyldisaccharide 4'-kinase